MSVKIVKWGPGENKDSVKEFIKRPAFDDKAEGIARKVLSEIQVDGDKAVAKYAQKFDNVSLKSSDFLVSKEEIAEARNIVDRNQQEAVREAHTRIAAFSKASMKKDWHMSSSRGGLLGEQFVPLERVGVYVPGGEAPLASTALMTITLAKVAGVSEIVVCTPCKGEKKEKPKEDDEPTLFDVDDTPKEDVKGDSKKLNPVLLYAMEIAGATEIYRVGGIQSVGMMAYGTRTVKKVQKIVGPGGVYVTAAKRQVYGHVALDLVAGPSEIVVLADDTADPRYIAADLLSQAEHGTGWEKAILVTTSMRIAKQVDEELQKQASTLSRQEVIQKVMKKGMIIVVVNTLDIGMDLCNEIAPEHFEIMVREPQSWLKKVKTAGAVFIGSWTPESVGDFVAGPSHVLPTGGAASMFSGLTVDDFRRRSSYISYTRADLHDVLPVIQAFGDMEGLDAHARSATIRFDKS